MQYNIFSYINRFDHLFVALCISYFAFIFYSVISHFLYLVFYILYLKIAEKAE